MNLITHAQELEWIQWIHQFRGTYADFFFTFLNFFDRQEFFFVLIPLIWLNYGWKAGLRLSYILLINTLVNKSLKDIFGSPRPFHMNPDLQMLPIPGLGFPSGAAQTVVLLSGLLLLYWKNAWKWLLALLYILFISFSRIYLGAHFPTDILGGWLVGLGILLLYFWLEPPIERKLNQSKPLTLFVLSQAIPMFAFMIWPFLARTSAVAMSMGLGILIMHAYDLYLMPPKSTQEYIFRALLGALGTFAIYFLTAFLPHSHVAWVGFIRFFLMGLWISLICPLICKGLAKENTKKEEKST